MSLPFTPLSASLFQQINQAPFFFSRKPSTTKPSFPIPNSLHSPLPMKETRTLPLLLLTLLFFSPTTTTAQTSSPEPLSTAAAQTLADNGFLSMALTLHLASAGLHLPSAATIFVPSDAAFLRSGPLPISLLQYHILPSRLPHQHLTTLQRGTPIPTLLPNSSLTVTTSSVPPHQLSLNDVVVAKTAIFDDGFLLMLPIPDFFNSSSLLVPEKIVPSHNNNEPFAAVSDVLKSNGFSIIASILEAQLATEFAEGAKFTIFAPIDEAIVQSVRDVADYSAIFRKHVVPRLIPWHDLIRLRDQTLLPTFSEGFLIRVTVAPRVRLLNGVTVAFPDLYRDDVIVVHGIDSLFDNSTV